MMRVGMLVMMLVIGIGILGRQPAVLGLRNTGAVGEWMRTQAAKVAKGLGEHMWMGIYPAAKWAVEERDEGQSAGELLLRMAYRMVPVSLYIENVPKEPAVASADPAYSRYLEDQEMYREYELMVGSGSQNVVSGYEGDGKETDLSEMTFEEAKEDQAQETSPASQAQAGQENASAVQESSALPVIGVEYSLEQLADFDYLMHNFYNVHSSTTAGRDLINAQKLLSHDLAMEKSESPQILIYHTHSQEEYLDYHTGNTQATVVNVGQYLTQLLEAKGYQVIHDTSVYDLVDGELDRNKAYTYALENVNRIVEENPSIQVVIDLHRDGVNESLHLVNEVNGKQTASIMFFNGLSQTPTGPIDYLYNPNLEGNLAFSLQMQMKAAAYYPGLTRKIYLKGLRYNLHLRPRSTLIEVGAQTNTYEEARNAMEPLAEILDMILSGR